MVKQINLLNLLTIMVVVLLSFTLSSCGDDDGDSIDNSVVKNQTERTSYEKEMEEKLKGTSWHYYRKTISYSSGEKETRNYSFILSFGNDGVCYYVGAGGNGEDYKGDWKMEDNQLKFRPGSGVSASEAGKLVALFGYGVTIEEISNISLKLKKDYGNGYYEMHYFSKVSYTESSDGGSGGGDSSTESLYFTNFNYTSTQTSVTVKFYTNEKPTSASIKYGENTPSTSASSTIISHEISATIRGLKKGTRYYVKCTASNSSCSVTSDNYPIMTNY